ncbi:response regulator [Kerstersia gyiorum]|jgi:two-component system phosphate regulon response regulator OmpR|uniref:Osmolarity response regulator n=1 Tax=Kerstersia gyiorum TaxID=206506 RepID=A0A171KNY9_9BURK|nr:response regulator [Kerstersia gyiorum]AZV92750.1 two-component system response regulator OmpR [Bordetella sp. J329]MCO7642277.1 response regulator [Pseudomonas sp. S 311-6]KAB0542249.1 response regulator [Kerstersia gyiorum]KKO70606.1 osmolarity response regulator [Kerstersia gyiorum]MCH4272971.1 response regulator [Kerstersia gyiorum]
MDKLPSKLLVVDDDPALRQLLAEYLNRHGYDTLLAPDATDLPARIARYSPDLIVLDRMLPGGDGAQACRQLREQGEDIPIILLTARDETLDRISGLEAGADDYLGKPFDPRELLARIEAVLRRKVGPSALNRTNPVNFGPFTYDPIRRQLFRDNEPMHLTGGEINLLEAFVNNPGKPLSREKLLALARDDDGERNDRAIDIAILRLRRVLEEDPKQPRWIQTVWGIGYRFAP